MLSARSTESEAKVERESDMSLLNRAARFRGTVLVPVLLLALACACGDGMEAPVRRAPGGPQDCTFDRGGFHMRYVPAGRIAIGVEASADPRLHSFDNSPRHEVALGAFWIDETEVRNSEYVRFLEATDHEPPLHLGKGVAEIRFRLEPGASATT